MSLQNHVTEEGFCTPTHPSRHSRTPFLNRSSTDQSPVITIPASPFMERLGYGTGVSVYLLERSPRKSGFARSPWAVKKVKAYKTATADINTEKRLKREAELLQKFKHESIIGYRGFSRSADGTLCLSMENGEKSLMDLIEMRSENGEDPFPARDVLKVALAVAKALSYIHNEHKVLHGDLKSANVLIQGDFEKIKLCDFGVSVKMKDDLSDIMDESEYYIGTEPWSAKEVIIGDRITDKTDIFAFGLVLWEMLALTIPHTHLLGDENDDSMDATWDESKYLEALGSRPPLPDINYDDNYLPVLELLTICTDEDPNRRPTAKEIVNMLE
ncbi:putative lymphokine-activated killer T-cell-originated protein kinase-like [Apostichopus japonicus]|uniref:Putative lymphokine-activated killer T-cell-originated protein kinase-like n=2 Tax=Stichopus japonicus TaxID=307972 RepID=A0A2G8KW59_STIJA|nr:putative lymphokine-activated killer T-cell-originated protein kinase-like [Apostichopus japonicus]